MLVPPISIDPELGKSSPPSRLSSVVLPEPDGPISARKSPCGMSSVTPLSTSMRSLPRVNDLWTLLILTSALMSSLSLNRDQHAFAQFGRRGNHHLVAALQSRHHLEPIAVGARGLDRAALDGVLADDEHEARLAVFLHRRLRHQRHRLRDRYVARVGFAQERHLHAHVGEDARIEL